MTDRDANAERRKPLRRRACVLVRPRDSVSEVMQDLGDAAHPCASDAYEMDVLDGVLHAATNLSI